MILKLLQISDLHFGPHFEKTITERILNLVKEQKPDGIIISGDLTQRAKIKQFQDCQNFLKLLKKHSSILVIPGNHDIPLYRIWERFLNPYGNYKKIISQELHQALIFKEQAVVIVGINTTHPYWRVTDPYLSSGELAFAGRYFAENKDFLHKILVVHQDPFAFPTKANLGQFTAWLEQHKVTMLLSGHSHVSFVNHMNLSQGKVLRVGCGTSTSNRRRGLEEDRNTAMITTLDGLEMKLTRHSFLFSSSEEVIETIFHSHGGDDRLLPSLH